MGKSGGTSWLNVVKKAFRSPAKDNSEKRSSKRREEQEQEEEEKKRGKRRWIFRKPVSQETTIRHKERNISSALNASTNTFDGIPVNRPSPEDAKSEKQRAIAVAMATTAAAEAAVATARAAAEIIRFSSPSISVPEQHSAVLIQAVFKGYLARQALRALKGLVKLQALVRGHNVRKQAKMTLQCMQALMRVQDQVCNQRKRLSYSRSLVSISRSANSIRESKPTCKIFTSGYEDGSDDGDNDKYTWKEIHGPLRKTKEAASKREISLAHAFSQQMWRSGKDQVSANNEEYNENARCSESKQTKRSEEIKRTSCERDPVKIVQIDTIQSSTSSTNNSWRTQARNYQDQHPRPSSFTASSPPHRLHQNLSVQSPIVPSPSRTKPLQMHSASPRFLGEERNYSAAQTPGRYTYFRRVDQCRKFFPAPQPKYMAATASANARARSLSAPRQRALTPEREKNGLEKKRLSFADLDPYNDTDASSLSSLSSVLRNSSYEMTDNRVRYEHKIFSPSTSG